MQSDSVQNRLLQCSAEWLSGRDNPQAAASAEQCRSDRASSTKMIQSQATALQTVLATGRAEHLRNE